jgi:hypothetical protein
LDGARQTQRSILKGFYFIVQTLNDLKQEKKNRGAQEWAELCRFYYSVCSIN